MAPSRKANVRRKHDARSRSPGSPEGPIRNREDLRGRRTRRSSDLSSRDHRTPIDCPLPRCNATTVHQHYNDLQYYNPHPANETRHCGYVSSHRVISLDPNVANGETATRDQEMLEPELSDDEEAAQGQIEIKHPHATEDDHETDDQEKATERRTGVSNTDPEEPKLSDNEAVAQGPNDIKHPHITNDHERNDQEGPTEQRTGVSDSTPEDPEVSENEEAAQAQNDNRQPNITNNSSTFDQEEPTERRTGVSDFIPGDPITSRRALAFIPGDPITSRRTLDFLEDSVTPLQAFPMEIDYEIIANAWDSRRVKEQPKEPPQTTSPEMQSIFDEWLVPGTPEQGSDTTLRDGQSLDVPLDRLRRDDGDRGMPSATSFSSPTPYMRQFQSHSEQEDFTSIFGPFRPL